MVAVSDATARAALLARFDQVMEDGIAATLRDAAVLDDADTTTAVFALFEATMASGHTRETLAMAYAQLAVRLRRTTQAVDRA